MILDYVYLLLLGSILRREYPWKARWHSSAREGLPR